MRGKERKERNEEGREEREIDDGPVLVSPSVRSIGCPWSVRVLVQKYWNLKATPSISMDLFRPARFMGFVINKFAINKFTVKTSTVNKSFGQSKTPQRSFIWPCLQHLACFHLYHLTLQVFETIPGTQHRKCFSLVCYSTLPQVLWHNYQHCVDVLDILRYRNWATTLYMVIKSWLKLLHHNIILAN